MNRTRVVTAAGDIDLETVLAESLTLRADVELVLRCLDRVELLAAIRGGGIDAIVLVGQVGWFDHQLAREASHQQVTIVALSSPGDAPGLAHVVSPDSSLDEILAACRAAPASPVEEIRTGTRGRLTAVWGPKGAPGRTRVAIDLAFALERAGSSSVLLDADPYGGDVTQLLRIIEELPTVVWAALMASKAELGTEELERNLRRAGDGPAIIPGIPRAELWPDVSEFGFRELLEVCRTRFDHTVVDAGFCLEPAPSLYPEGGDGRNRMTRASLRSADRVIAVCNATPVGIRNFLWTFGELRTLADLDRIVIAANRVPAGSERDIARLLHKHLGKRPAAYLPDEPDVVAAAAEAGTASWNMKGGGQMRAAIEALAVSVGAKLRARGLLSRLGARA